MLRTVTFQALIPKCDGNESNSAKTQLCTVSEEVWWSGHGRVRAISYGGCDDLWPSEKASLDTSPLILIEPCHCVRGRFV